MIALDRTTRRRGRGFFLLAGAAALSMYSATVWAASPLKAARACAARADSACVVGLLEPATPTATEAPEHWLALAFAMARLGQRSKAQAAFRAWLALSPTHRLDRGQVPARIWPDYVAALLAHHGGALDLEPKVARTPEPVPVGGAWRDLPKIPPPPRSGRDAARDTEFVVGPNGGLVPGRSGVAAGLDLLMRVRTAKQLLLGLGMVGISIPGTKGARDLAAGVGLHGEWQLHTPRWGRLSVGLLAGGGLVQGADGSQRADALVIPSVRCAWLPRTATVGVELSLADRVWFGGGSAVHVVGLSIGLLLRPGRAPRVRHAQAGR